MNLYRVKMSRSGGVFMVAAINETVAARMAELQWDEWGYHSNTKAVAVELAGFGGQYPPDTGGCSSSVPWFLISEEATP